MKAISKAISMIKIKLNVKQNILSNLTTRRINLFWNLRCFSENINNRNSRSPEDIYIDRSLSLLNSLYEQLDEKELECINNIEYADGVLNFSLSNQKHYVINIQRPNRQIWLSSPRSGPQRFEYDEENHKWFNIRNKKDLLEIINEEIDDHLLQLGIKDTSIKLEYSV